MDTKETINPAKRPERTSMGLLEALLLRGAVLTVSAVPSTRGLDTCWGVFCGTEIVEIFSTEAEAKDAILGKPRGMAARLVG